MRGRIHLAFPKIIYIESTTNPKTGKDIQVYKLDWEPVDKQAHKSYLHFLEVGLSNSKENFFKLPDDVIEYIDDRAFSIPKGYMDEIIRCTQSAIMEDSIRRPFDTSIREMCLNIRDSYIYVAFKLLADCLYSESALGWDRSIDRRVLFSAFSWRFWAAGHTGTGLIKSKCDFDRASEGKDIDWLVSSFNAWYENLEDKSRNAQKHEECLVELEDI